MVLVEYRCLGCGRKLCEVEQAERREMTIRIRCEKCGLVNVLRPR
jgi:DNA-directed RNA polymerase subunit RPC12/RpoP